MSVKKLSALLIMASLSVGSVTSSYAKPYDFGSKEIFKTLSIDALKKKIKQGDVSAKNELGCRQLEGLGIPQDSAQGIKYLRAAANQNLMADQGWPISQYYLGILYNLGQGVEKNNQVAAEWYRKAANKGYLEAKACLEHLEKYNSPMQQKSS